MLMATLMQPENLPPDEICARIAGFLHSLRSDRETIEIVLSNQSTSATGPRGPPIDETARTEKIGLYRSQKELIDKGISELEFIVQRCGRLQESLTMIEKHAKTNAISLKDNQELLKDAKDEGAIQELSELIGRRRESAREYAAQLTEERNILQKCLQEATKHFKHAQLHTKELGPKTTGIKSDGRFKKLGPMIKMLTTLSDKLVNMQETSEIVKGRVAECIAEAGGIVEEY